ncbi:MAG TPA: hypothetical protein VK841_04170, partial [Polyangiaceae bacterium]|nr:hypothetical protein [Polyangiaceae bacterium]
MRARFRAVLFAVAVCGLAVPACANLVGVQDYNFVPDGGASPQSTTGSGTGEAAGSFTGSTGTGTGTSGSVQQTSGNQTGSTGSVTGSQTAAAGSIASTGTT